MSSLDDLSRSILPQLFVIVILTIINGFFSAAQISFVSSNNQKVIYSCQDKGKKTMLLSKLLENPTNFLSTIQIGITLAGFLSSASAATLLSFELFKVLSPYDINYVQEISIVLITIVLSFLTLVFGDFLPKKIALKKYEKVDLNSIKSIYFVSKVSKLFKKILLLLTKAISKITHKDYFKSKNNITTDEIKSLITQSQKNGTINFIEKEMIDKIFDFSYKMSKEIMTSRKDTVLINIDDTKNTKLNILLNCKYSRIPVYKDSIDNIIGILYIKDLISHLVNCNFENLDLKSLLHSPSFVPETKRIDELFVLLKQNKNHMAILIDEYGGFSGIVTMEDIIEEIVGDIEDEYDIDNYKVKNLGHGSFEIKGNMSILDFNNTFNTNIHCDDCDTINGYIISKIDKIPRNEENIIINIDNCELQVIEVDDNRIEKLKINFAKESAS